MKTAWCLPGPGISGNARLTQPCIVSHRAHVGGNGWLDAAEVSHGAVISDNVTIQHSTVRGECRIAGDARVLHNSLVIAAKGLTPDREQILQIYDRATVSQSRIVHQAQIYGDAMVTGPLLSTAPRCSIAPLLRATR